jgi:hypothetical protein
MIEYNLVADNYFVLFGPCGCKGDPECDCVDGMQPVGEVALDYLLRNLAVAGALTRAFDLGADLGAAIDRPPHDDSMWQPNVDGRAA